jgi:hypothetical protein
VLYYHDRQRVYKEVHGIGRDLEYKARNLES